jgi:putative CRISPR-associated protein (TIGR02619 family)
MRRVVISTVGTSLLTNQINRSNLEEKDWYSQLRDTANSTLEKTPKNVLKIIETLKVRAIKKLEQSSTAQIRSASAELNGIYGLYQEQLELSRQDMHWLVATDTAQGKETAEIVESFLQTRGITVQIYTPKGLSTTTTRCFSDGIDELLTQLDPMTSGYERVCFNLVGGFKSLQAYLNTIGMFYADEIIYIFEGFNSEVITIPRLPIKD